MKERTTVSRTLVWSSIREVFSMFWAQGRRTRRTKVFYLFSLFPALIAVLDVGHKIITRGSLSDGMNIYSNVILVFYLQFFILLLALFFGTSVCSEEIEGKTLTYLTTRPIPKGAILLGKYAAYTLLTVLMTTVGVVLAFLILNLNRLTDLSIYGNLFRDLAVLSLGLICYTALFTSVGTFMRRAIIFGLAFSFGWENVIQYFPGSTQKLTVVHYLKSLLPATSGGGRLTVLLFRLQPTSAPAAVGVLLLLTAAFLAVAVILFSRKEYIFED